MSEETNNNNNNTILNNNNAIDNNIININNNKNNSSKVLPTSIGQHFQDQFIDVVGVDSELNGRSCSTHPCCGHTIVVGDKLVCNWGVAVTPKKWQLKTLLKKNATEEEIEEHVKVHKIDNNGLATCHVGYLPKRLFKQYTATSFHLMYLRIKEDLRVSENQHERSRSGRFLGIVLCEVIRDNPKYNGHNRFDNDATYLLITIIVIFPLTIVVNGCN